MTSPHGVVLPPSDPELPAAAEVEEFLLKSESEEDGNPAVDEKRGIQTKEGNQCLLGWQLLLVRNGSLELWCVQ